MPAFPTATITQGSGLTINTLPNAGQGNMASSLSVVIASDQSAVPISGPIALSAGAATIGKVDLLGNAGAAMDAAGQNAASPANELLVGGQFNTSPTTITSGNMSPLQLDSAANLLVNVKTAIPAGNNLIGSVTSLNSGAITNPTSVLTRPSSAVTASVTATSATPCVFTWTSSPVINGNPIILGGTAVPTGFTAGTVYYAVGVSGSTFQLSATVGGAAIASSSTGTAVTATLTYVPNTLIASALATGSVVVPSFAIATSAGGVILPRVRVLTSATSGWNGVNLSVNLWSAAPTYTGGDTQPYAASGAATWLASYLVSLTQFNDGAVGGGGITNASQLAEKLASGTAIFWDLQILSQVLPGVSQTFTITAELLN